MELRSLRYFMAIAKEQNMTNAAAVLHISQPALSYQIAELEKEAGCLLFERTGRKMVLTEEGIKLLSRAERILELADQITDNLKDTGSEIAGDVYIGAAESSQIHLIADAIESLQKQYPDIRYHFYSGNLDDVYSRLSRGDLDFAVMIEPFGFENCETILFPEVDVEGVLIRKDHPLSDHQSITAEDLKELPLLINSRSNFILEDFARHFAIPKEKLKIAGSGNLIYNKAILAEHGIGAAVTLKDLVRCDENSPLVFIPFEPRIEKHLVFAWKKYRPLSSAAAALLREVQEQIRKQ